MNDLQSISLMERCLSPVVSSGNLAIQLNRKTVRFQLQVFNKLRERGPLRAFLGLAIYDDGHGSSVAESFSPQVQNPSNLRQRIPLYFEMAIVNVSKLPIRGFDDGNIIVVIETPKDHRNKFKYDEEHGMFKLSSVLPAGSSFPYDFGFIPSTKAPDGDPLDVLVLMDEAAFPGCMIEARLIGVIEAEQSEEGKTSRNDRLIAVAAKSKDYSDLRSLRDVNGHLVDEIQHFFVSYNESRGTKFKPLGVYGPKRALKLLEKSATKRLQKRNEKGKAA
ncbi:MAG TPA: inorganic diphosphatase [Terriglobales bacterium]|nr:inorganic diphosphatase [Terriglobales bacterium]